MPTYDYLSGFNSGYILAEYEPAVLAEVTKGLHAANRCYPTGLVDGGNEYLLFQSKSKLQSLESLRLKGCERDQEREL